jgi:hypothetical protein
VILGHRKQSFEGLTMTDTAIFQRILAEQLEIKAMLQQLGAVRSSPTTQDEIAACRAQGIDLATYFKAKGKAAPRKRQINGA